MVSLWHTGQIRSIRLLRLIPGSNDTQGLICVTCQTLEAMRHAPPLAPSLCCTGEAELSLQTRCMLTPWHQLSLGRLKTQQWQWLICETQDLERRRHGPPTTNKSQPVTIAWQWQHVTSV